MVVKLTPILIEKYDITNKILNHLTDLESRHILFSIIKTPKTAKQISQEQKIPVSTTYKKIQTLLEASLIEAQRDFNHDGKIIRFYQSKIDDIHITISKFAPLIHFKKNPNIKNE